jgi:hypothetical protein
MSELLWGSLIQCAVSLFGCFLMFLLIFLQVLLPVRSFVRGDDG